MLSMIDTSYIFLARDCSVLGFALYVASVQLVMCLQEKKRTYSVPARFQPNVEMQ